MNIFQGQQFRIRETGEVIRLVEVKEKDGAKKLPDPIFKFSYYSKKPDFTTYRSQVEKHLKYNSWILTNI
jgi:hypothetical protein